MSRRLRDLTASGLPVGPARTSQAAADALDRLAARSAALAASARASARVPARHLGDEALPYATGSGDGERP